MRNSVADIRTYATSLTKGLKLLSLFTRERPEWGVSEMSVAIGAAKSTVSRIARTLEAQGFLMRAQNSDRFRLGLKLWEIGVQAIGDKTDLPHLARRHLESVVSEAQESAQAVILDNMEAVYVEKVEAPRSIRTWCMIGQRFPLHCTATGKALLAFQPESLISKVLSSRLRAATPRTITDSEQLHQELQAIRNRGFALNKAEWREDIGGIAAPVFDRHDDIVGAIGVTMPLSRFPREVTSPVSTVVVAAAHRLSRELGYMLNEVDRGALSPGRSAGRRQRGLRR
jgi:DNA-binding IclR family transcriptional regulator